MKLKLHQKIYIPIKYCLSFFFAILALILVGWFMLIIALLIKIDDKGPVLFKQQRVGKNKKLFTCYKFRTMKVDTIKALYPYDLLLFFYLYQTSECQKLRYTYDQF